MNRLPPHQAPSGPIQKALGFVLTLALLGLGLMFSMVFFAVAVVVGIVLWVYLWWRTRDLRRQMREEMARQQGYPPGNGTYQRDTDDQGGIIIEGEVIREDKSKK